jgi:hypothetical protein
MAKSGRHNLAALGFVLQNFIFRIRTILGFVLQDFVSWRDRVSAFEAAAAQARRPFQL